MLIDYILRNQFLVEKVYESYRESNIKLNICLIGSTGFIGTWFSCLSQIINQSGKNEIKITGLSRNKNITTNKMLNYNHLSSDDLSTIKFDKFTHVIWAATSTHKNAVLQDSGDLFNKIIDKMSNDGFLGKFINLSSGAVYSGAFTSKIDLKETSSIHNLDDSQLNEYTKSKINIENTIKKIHNDTGLNILNLRLFSFCGPGMPTSLGYAMHDFFSKLVSRENLIILKNPNTLRSYMHPADLVLTIYNLILKNDSGIIDLNIGSKEVKSIYDIAKKISILGGLDVEIKGTLVDPMQDYYPNLENLIKNSDYNNIFDFDLMIKDTYEYYKQLRI